MVVSYSCFYDVDVVMYNKSVGDHNSKTFVDLTSDNLILFNQSLKR